MYNRNFRHIHRRHNTIKHLLSNEVIFIDYVKSKDNIVDPLTKICRESLCIIHQGEWA
jgi:hypothetical protein